MKLFFSYGGAYFACTFVQKQYNPVSVGVSVYKPMYKPVYTRLYICTILYIFALFLEFIK